jgi:hypothetical protein
VIDRLSAWWGRFTWRVLFGVPHKGKTLPPVWRR